MAKRPRRSVAIRRGSSADALPPPRRASSNRDKSASGVLLSKDPRASSFISSRKLPLIDALWSARDRSVFAAARGSLVAVGTHGAPSLDASLRVWDVSGCSSFDFENDTSSDASAAGAILLLHVPLPSTGSGSSGRISYLDFTLDTILVAHASYLYSIPITSTLHLFSDQQHQHLNLKRVIRLPCEISTVCLNGQIAFVGCVDGRVFKVFPFEEGERAECIHAAASGHQPITCLASAPSPHKEFLAVGMGQKVSLFKADSSSARIVTSFYAPHKDPLSQLHFVSDNDENKLYILTASRTDSVVSVWRVDAEEEECAICASLVADSGVLRMWQLRENGKIAALLEDGRVNVFTMDSLQDCGRNQVIDPMCRIALEQQNSRIPIVSCMEQDGLFLVFGSDLGVSVVECVPKGSECVVAVSGKMAAASGALLLPKPVEFSPFRHSRLVITAPHVDCIRGHSLYNPCIYLFGGDHASKVLKSEKTQEFKGSECEKGLELGRLLGQALRADDPKLLEQVLAEGHRGSAFLSRACLLPLLQQNDTDLLKRLIVALNARAAENRSGVLRLVIPWFQAVFALDLSILHACFPSRDAFAQAFAHLCDVCDMRLKTAPAISHLHSLFALNPPVSKPRSGDHIEGLSVQQPTTVIFNDST